jgi:predicted SnoaL-like aldol condensation-catalyzing enzyme
MTDNMQIVLNAFETLFNKRDYAAAERFWSPNYIQHSAHIPPGREGLFALIKGAPEALRYENGLAVSHGDYVWLHGRFSGRRGPRRARCNPRSHRAGAGASDGGEGQSQS